MNDLMEELDRMVEEQRSAKGAKSKAKANASPAKGGSKLANGPKVEVEAAAYAPMPHQAKRRIFIVREQQCKRCGSKHPVLAGEFIEFAFPGGLNTHRSIVAPGSDHTFDWLPKEVEWLEVEAVTCPTCLTADIILDEIVNVLTDDAAPRQLPLFPWSEQGAQSGPSA